MALIRAVCNDCGDEVDLQPREITLVVAEESVTAPRAGSYGFTCPACERYVVKPADERAIGLLIAGGVEPSRVGGALTTATMPVQRPTHPEQPPDGPPISWDDVLDMHLLLEEEDWFDRLRALTVRPW